MTLIDKLTAIGDGFRTSRGTTQEYTLDEMAVLAAEKSGGVIEPLSVTANGTYNPPEGVDGYSPVTVNVESGSDEEWFNDGDTHIWVTLYEGRTTMCLTWTTGGTATVDWGDGTEPEVVASAGAYSVTKTQDHKYDKPGDYVIRISGAELQFVGDRNNGVSTLVLSGRNVSYGNVSNYGCRNRVKKIEVGNSTTIDAYAFAGLNSVGEVFMQSCKETISNNAFDNCYSLTRITFPGNVKTLGGNMCKGCYSMRYLDFTGCETVPALSATTALSAIPTDCEIRVPAALYDEWIAATNWSTYASHIVAV